MRLVTFVVDSRQRVGAFGRDEADPGPGAVPWDLTAAAERAGEPLPSLADALAAGPAGLERLDSLLARARREGLAAPPGFRLGPPLPRPGKLICAAGNYQEHLREGGAASVDKARTTPRLFLKPATAVIGPGEPIAIPPWSDAVDWELELGVVIGRRGRHIPAREALGYVAGYVVFNDVSARRLTVAAGRQPRPWDEFFDWLHGKWFDTFAAMGPALVTADEVPDPHRLQLRLTVNGQTCQDASTEAMIFRVEELISFASNLMTLEPGDVLATGTPSGVGDARGLYLRPGDVVEGTITGLGTLRNPVVAGPAEAAPWRLPGGEG